MSIATLKRKTQAQYHNMSVSQPQFSLNGTRRSQGYVGQDSLSRSLPVTPMRGQDAKGYGGCCGLYPISNVSYGSGIYSWNDSSVVKLSTQNEKGLLLSKYRWVRRPEPFSTTKSPPVPHMEKLRNAVLAAAAAAETLPTDASGCIATEEVPAELQPLFTRSYTQINHFATLAQTKPFPVLDQGQYLLTKGALCGSLNKTFVLGTQHTPVGCS